MGRPRDEEIGRLQVWKARMSRLIKSHEDLDKYQMAFEAAMSIFNLSRGFPREETYSLTDQMRRSSRSACSNLAEAWRKRRYKAAFVAKLCAAESEAIETQTWIQFAAACGYLSTDQGKDLFQTSDNIVGKLVNMIRNSSSWTLSGNINR